MIGSFKIVLAGLFATLFVVAQAYCACMASMDIAHTDPSMGEMANHDHSAMHEMFDTEEPACPHCESDLNKAALSTGSFVILSPIHAVAYRNTTVLKTFDEPLYLPAQKTLNRRAWLDPPPPLIATPITLKTRLLT